MTANQKQGQHRTRATSWKDAYVHAPIVRQLPRIGNIEGRQRTVGAQTAVIDAWLVEHGMGTAGQIFAEVIQPKWPMWTKGRVTIWLHGAVRLGRLEKLPGGMFKLRKP